MIYSIFEIRRKIEVSKYKLQTFAQFIMFELIWRRNNI
jgi:hypothetical protein